MLLQKTLQKSQDFCHYIVHYLCYIHYVVKGVIIVNTKRQLIRVAEDAVRKVVTDLGGGTIQIIGENSRETRWDAIFEITAGKKPFTIAIEVKSRITPQTAMWVCEQMRGISGDLIPVVFAPVISMRVAEILERHGIGHVDQAGNCRVRSVRHGLLIDRRGYKAPSRPSKGIGDLFSPKSSRIVRAMLAQPAKGWKVREIAAHPNVVVSLGLAAKVKQTLVEESYAIEHERLLYLSDPVGLLENWAKSYSGPAEQIPMFFRGNTETAEQAVAAWCRDNDIPYALSGFSAAWRLSPEVRYSVANMYVDDRGFDRESLDKLRSYQGGKTVESGANLLLWRPYDRSALIGSREESRKGLPFTSAIQTFLDLKRLAGRGEEAAGAIYEKILAQPLMEAALRIEEMRHGAL